MKYLFILFGSKEYSKKNPSNHQDGGPGNEVKITLFNGLYTWVIVFFRPRKKWWNHVPLPDLTEVRRLATLSALSRSYSSQYHRTSRRWGPIWNQIFFWGELCFWVFRVSRERVWLANVNFSDFTCRWKWQLQGAFLKRPEIWHNESIFNLPGFTSETIRCCLVQPKNG